MWVKFTHTEHRLAGLHLFFEEFDRARGDVVVDRLHPLFGQRAGVLDLLLAVRARFDRRIVD